MKEIVFNSIKETQSFAADFAKTIPPGTVIGLLGNLGTGKTTFSQGFANGLGIKDKVISPTFKLVSEYNSNPPLYHIDCYRLDSSFDFLNIGGEEFINSNKSITLIEWAERIKSLWSENWIFINFNLVKNKPDSRKIEFPDLIK